MRQTKKRLRAADILDAARNIVKRHGRFEEINFTSHGTTVPHISCKIGGFSIAHSTPFQQQPIDWEIRRKAAQLGLSAEALKKEKAYNLDIWKGKKVFGVAWDDDDELDIYNFQRGDWEAEFLRLVSE